MTTDDAAIEWHWIDEQGRQRQGSERKFLGLVAARRLEAKTLVWRTGWLEWLKANQVAELADLLPRGSVVTPVMPRTDRKAVAPPPVPETLEAQQPPERAQPAPAARVALGGPTAAGRGTPVPPVPPRGALRRRPAMPTLMDAAGLQATDTLRPPAAVPPPPRGVPTPPQAEAEPEEGSLRVLQRFDPTSTPVPPGPVVPEAADPAPAPAEDRPAEPGEAKAPASTLGTTAFGVERTAELDLPRTGRIPAMARVLLPYVALGATTGLLGAATVAWWKQTPTTHDPPVAKALTPAATAAPAEPPGPAPGGPCQLSKPAQRLSPSILLNIPPYVAIDPEGRAAIGFADHPKGGLGIVVDPSSLLVGHVFRGESTAELLGVVPVAGPGRLDFIVSSGELGLDVARAVDGPSPFILGYADTNLVRASGPARDIIWDKVAAQAITDPRVATVPGLGHAVAFRSDGQGGRVRYGWLTPDGKKKSELWTVEVEGSVGTPAVAAGPKSALIAFAVKSKEETAWHIELVRAESGAPPERSVRFSLPEGGPGSEAMSPAPEALPDGRWLLQWTEGPAGQRDVRVQTLSQQLEPIGPAVTASPKNANAGQGVVWVNGTEALSTFLVASQQSHELWGTALKCP